MEVWLAYGKDGITIEVPDWAEVDLFGLARASVPPATYDDFAAAFEAAGGRAWAGSEVPLVIVNDGHRDTPTAQILGWFDQLDASLLAKAHFLIATGSHDQPTETHLETIFGQYLQLVRPRLHWHDARDQSEMVQVASDHDGSSVYLNRRVTEAELPLVLTSVEPHYFAGFTGGRKSFFPGLTDLATIERNHNRANSLDCAPLKLDGNPMAEHLDELAAWAKIDQCLSIQVVADNTHTIRNVYCGPLRETFLHATEGSAKLYANQVAQPYDLALAEVRPPLDRNLYQIQKALENCQAAVADNGTAVVVAACSEGVGSPHFFELADHWDAGANRPVDGVPRFGAHKLSRVNGMRRRIRVRLYSELPDDQPRRVFYEPVADLQRLINDCLDEDKCKRLAIVYDAGHTVLQPMNAS